MARFWTSNAALLLLLIVAAALNGAHTRTLWRIVHSCHCHLPLAVVPHDRPGMIWLDSWPHQSGGFRCLHYLSCMLMTQAVTTRAGLISFLD